MAARLPTTLRSALLIPSARTLSTTTRSSPFLQHAQRSFQTSRRAMQEATVLPPRRPVGAFRGTLFGFLLGSVIAGAGLYYYVIDEYKVSNELLTEDIYALQAAVQRLEGYVKNLEEGVKVKK
ncbi:hypothetical protein BDY17DRAFT_299928 [Neohortaea acidophila]|uniref:Uncharacterized protein n=1 Tax=Neohortaea acidophila TaxID=245834 RepID=A0A6A6PPB3_9PEZI|nr:uncharacterized protein BDY17DRAFT_299928 [Neohortaea acidophila]KAF2481919.1 hypothetical protein BDY17DRAFT_299928 [Neohortaea acidophila]